jgi:hypothetical protein
LELQILPEAVKEGWPQTIEWDDISERVLSMKAWLEALIEDPGDDFMDDDGRKVLFSERTESKEKKKGPKASCIFWTDVMDEVKKKGLRAVSSALGHFSNFEKTQPG